MLQTVPLDGKLHGVYYVFRVLPLSASAPAAAPTTPLQRQLLVCVCVSAEAGSLSYLRTSCERTEGRKSVTVQCAVDHSFMGQEGRYGSLLSTKRSASYGLKTATGLQSSQRIVYPRGCRKGEGRAEPVYICSERRKCQKCGWWCVCVWGGGGELVPGC